MRTLLLCLAFASSAFAASPNPAPIPTPKATVTFTQGTVSRTLPAIAPTACLQIVGTVIRAKVGTCNNDSGSYVQFPSNGGSVSVHWSVQDACPTKPAPLTRHADCPAGTKGSGWTQTAVYTSADAPTCWVLGPYLPDAAPADTCTAVGPPPFTWRAPVAPAQIQVLPKPAKGGSYTTLYGTTVTRFTDHAADLLPYNPPWLIDIYSRVQGFNADKSLIAVYRPDGGYQVYTYPAGVALHTLTGVGGDPEFQWSATDPHVGYYLGNLGGTVLRKIDAITNVSSVVYDFTADVRALLGADTNRCSTKSEGSPSADGRIWALLCFHEQSGTWPTRGYIAIDTVARRIVWSKATTVAGDSISASPSGRYAVVNGTGSTPTVSYAIPSGTATTALNHGEHSDLMALPNGHDALFTCDYSAAGDGWCFVFDLDTGVRTNIVRLYNNAAIGDNYAVHLSGKAFGAPGWMLMGSYGGSTQGSNLMLIRIGPPVQIFGLSTLFSATDDYFDEEHAFISRDGKTVCYNENWQHSLASDVVCMNVPALPQ